jgi:hypothetical protein
MHKVSINKDGLFFSFWDESSEDWIKKNIADSSLPITWFMNYAVEIEEGLSVHSVLTLLKPYSDIIKLYFVQSLSGVSLEEIFMTADQSSISAKKIDANQVFLLKAAQVSKIKEDEDLINFITVHNVLMGLQIINEDDPDTDILHPLASINFQDWCNLPLVADDWLEYVDPHTEQVYFEGVTNWTFSEIISTILSQTAITLQITQTVSEKSAKTPVEDGPVEISHVWDWLEDLDNIFLKK